MRPHSFLVAAAMAGSMIAACSSTSLAPLPGDDAGAADATADATPQRDGAVVDASPAADTSTGEGGIGGCGTSRDSGSFPPFTDACTNDHDCVLVIHQLDCCGTQEAIGINVSARNDFDTDEPIWRNSCPACGCAQQPTFAQDGKTGPIASMRVTCSAGASGSGVCRTYVQM